MVGTTLPTPMYALYADRMHFAVLTTTVIYATYAGGVLFALLVFGRWSDAIGRRPVLLAAWCPRWPAPSVFLVADSVPMLLVARVLSGLSAGIFTGTATAAVIEAAPPSWRDQGRRGRDGRQHRRAGHRAAVGRACWSQYAPAPLHLSFIVHIVLALLAGVRGAGRTGDLAAHRHASVCSGCRCPPRCAPFSSSPPSRRSPASR